MLHHLSELWSTDFLSFHYFGAGHLCWRVWTGPGGEEGWSSPTPARPLCTLSLCREVADGPKARVCRCPRGPGRAVPQPAAPQVENSQAFAWQSQLRHRWDDGERHCYANICDAQLLYAYEYLGNTPRLVITPLTDRLGLPLPLALRPHHATGPAQPLCPPPQVLHHPDTVPPPLHGGSPRWPCRHRENRDHQGPGPGRGYHGLRVQLLRADGLQGRAGDKRMAAPRWEPWGVQDKGTLGLDL